MEWSDYIVTVAAPHSKDNARHWFRYLRKYVDKCGISFSQEDIDSVYRNEALTPFQRVSIKAAFREGSPTREYIIGLNHKKTPEELAEMRKRYENLGKRKQ